jgi:hypothetical protein
MQPTRRRETEEVKVDIAQLELEKQMGVFPDWLWQRDDFQSTFNYTLSETCLRILGLFPDERQDLHVRKLRQWVMKKDGPK